MLSDEVIEKVVERLVNRIEQCNTYVLKKIGESINKVGTLYPSKANQLVNVLKYGGDFEKIVEYIAEITKLNVKDIYKIFEEVAKVDYRFAKQFYDYKGINYIPYEENIALQNQVKALARITANEYVNFSNTLAFAEVVDGKVHYTDLSKVYYNVIDEAVLSIAQGKDTFDSQMTKVIKELSSSGIKTVDYASGRAVRLDSSVRQHMKGALRNLHNEMQAMFGEEFGSNGVEISVHLNPAPDHAEVQGRQFSKEEFYKFQNDEDSISYDGTVFSKEHDGKDRRSISQYNCYHYVFDVILGVSKPIYSDEELKEIIENNNKGFEFDGKNYTNYEGTQLQRQIETAIRREKDMQITLNAALSRNIKPENQEKMITAFEKSKKKVRLLNDKYKRLCNVSGLPSKKERMRVSGYRNFSVDKYKS